MAVPLPREQFGALVHSFLARFFENEITSGTDDLKSSFFWLLAFLMAPGLFMPVLMYLQWDGIAQFGGYQLLQVLTRGDKAFYLGFSMVATALVSAMVWSSLLLDRRDGLILGAMPVRPGVVVGAKLAALGVYILLVAVGMHTMSALSFGTALANYAPFTFMLRSIAAHFVVPCAASAFVVLTIAGIQGAALAITGPRVFSRVTMVLHLGLVGAIVIGLLALPLIDVSVVDTLRGAGGNARPWLLDTPPLWFLGAYEWILGADDPLLMRLGQKAVLAFAASATLTALTYPMAYRRLMVSVVETGAEFGRTGRLAAAGEAVTRLSAARPELRAVSQFLIATLSRVDRHRFVMATALGLAAAGGLSTWFALIIDPRDPANAPVAPLWPVQLAALTFVLVGLRMAAALPADIKASWLFDVHAPSRRHIHVAIERVMFTAGVLPVAVAGMAVYWWLLEHQPALTGPADAVALVVAMQAIVTLAAGVLLIQVLLWRFEGMPCARLWEPERLQLRKRWAVYIAAFIMFTGGIPLVDRLLLSVPGRSISLVLLLTTAALWVRFWSLRQPARVVDVDAVTGGVLNLQ